MQRRDGTCVLVRAKAEDGGLRGVLAALTTGVAVVVVAGFSGLVAGAWLLNW